MINLLNIIKKTCIITGLLSLLYSCKKEAEYLPIDSIQELEFIYLSDLENCQKSIAYLIKGNDIDSLQWYYKEARNSFKKIEPILSFHDINNYNFLNAPNILKVEEEDLTDIKINEARSFQTLEESIFTDEVNHDSIKKTAAIITSRLELINKNSDLSHYKSYHLLWLIRKQLIRTTTTGITGFDSPVLESSLDDAVIAFAKVKQITTLYSSNFTNKELERQWIDKLDNASLFLSKSEFNDFNRYMFIKEHINPILLLWTKIGKDWNVEFPLELAISNNATNLFSKETLSLDYFAGYKVEPLSEEKIALGKRLFNDTNLSTNGNISCATCHKTSLAFTDGLVKPKGLSRNSPTLTYSAYQKGFFHDKRAGSLEGQIMSVIKNDQEFHSNLKNFTSIIENDSTYVNQFKKTYLASLNQVSVRIAIANYVRSLNEWDSKFDKNIRGELHNLTTSEINGFNLFNGKAKCATCHFAPVFNGTVPPNFKETEMEHLGVPSKAVIENAVIDTDLGRYDLFKTENRKHFFKTPTIRNIELTAPYMHNGVYNTLEEVVDFYNRGGGHGIGITDQEYQTLPPDPLNLTGQEINDLINFMKTLTDNRFITE